MFGKRKVVKIDTPSGSEPKPLVVHDVAQARVIQLTTSVVQNIRLFIVNIFLTLWTSGTLIVDHFPGILCGRAGSASYNNFDGI